MGGNFDLKKFLVENKLTHNSRLLAEAVEVPEWLKGKLADVHGKPGQGSIFAKPIDTVMKTVQQIVDSAKNVDQVANSTGTLTVSSPGIGYNLVLPLAQALKLPGAKQGEVEKVEGPNKIKVPSVTTTAPLSQFASDKLTVIVRPKKDEAGTVIPNEYIVLSAFPGDPDIPRASEWGGKFAVVIPSSSKLQESRKVTNRSKIITERRLALTPDDTAIVNKVADTIGNFLESGQADKKVTYNIGTYDYTLADGSPGKVSFTLSYIDNNSTAHFQRTDATNLEDNKININSKVYIPAFDNIFMNIWQVMTGRTAMEDLKRSITHELIHAKDPAVNHHLLKEPYDSSKVEVYYKSWAEFPTMTGQFMEAILRRTDRLVQQGLNEKSYNTIQVGLQSILDVYTGKETYFKNETYVLLTGHNAINLLEAITQLAVAIGLILMGKSDSLANNNLDNMQAYISAIKQYHIEAYNEFLKDLYLTVQEAVENVNSKLPEGFPPMQVGGTGSFKTSFKGGK